MSSSVPYLFPFPIPSVSRPLLTAFLGGVLGFLALVVWTQMYVVAGGAILAVALTVLFVRFPRFWLYISVVMWGVWFRASDEGLTIADFLLVAFYISSLGGWFLTKLIRREKIVRNAADWLMLLMFFLSSLNVCVALLNNIDPVSWLREYLLLVFLLYYLPIRDSFREKKYLQRLLFVAAAVVFVLGVLNLQMYMKAANNAVYAFNILSSRVALNEFLFLGASLISIVCLLQARHWLAKSILLLLVLFYSSVLIASFTRGAWLAFLVGVCIIFLMVDKRQKIRLSLFALVTTVGFILTVMLFFGHIGDFIFKNIESRFFSSSKGIQDISLATRIMESEAALKNVAAFPLSGSGMGAHIKFYDIIIQQTSTPAFIHNGYVFIVFKLGIPLGLLFICALAAFVPQGIWVWRQRGDTFYWYISIGATACLIAVLLVSVTSNQFATRDGLMTIAFYLALISITREHARSVTEAKTSMALTTGPLQIQNPA